MEKTNERITAVFSTIGAGVLILFGGLWLLGSILSVDLKYENDYLVLLGLFIIIISAI